MNPNEALAPIASSDVLTWSARFRGWHYHPSFVVPPSPADGAGFSSTDCPLVYQLRGDKAWYMAYTGFDGRGYQTMLATSRDLVTWEPVGVALGYGRPGTFDFGGVSFGGVLFESYDLDAPRFLKRVRGSYWALYGCYPRQGGYELRPGAQGLARSDDGRRWHRASQTTPVLSVEGAAEWEHDCIYEPWLLEHAGTYYNFYNAANGSVEQMGLAHSTNLTNWTRYAGSPILRNGEPGAFDDQFCSDGKVYRDGDHWVMIYFGVGRGGAHIMAAYSRDLLAWVKDPEPLYLSGGHPGELDATYAHKVSLTYNPGKGAYYMHYCAVGGQGRGIGLLTSRPL
jgi:predicted GH43/DUF377 family glycosyl hydrolase